MVTVNGRALLRRVAVNPYATVWNSIHARMLSVARATSHTFFVDDARAGLALMAVAAGNSWFGGVLGVIGAILAEAVGRALSAPKTLNVGGLIPLNGYFAALAVGVFFPVAAETAALALAAAALAALLTIGLNRTLAIWSLPVLVLPYVMAFAAAWLLCPQLSWCAASLLPLPSVAWPAAFPELVIFASKAWSAGLAELVFSSSPWIGLGVLLALALFDWHAAALAALGAACGTLTAIGLGLPASLTAIGLYGFGAALTTLALRRGTVRCGWLATLAAASVTAVATAILGTLGSTLGLLPLAAPYVVVVWICTLVQPVHVSEEGEAKLPRQAATNQPRLPRHF
jgi:urea transporter